MKQMFSFLNNIDSTAECGSKHLSLRLSNLKENQDLSREMSNAQDFMEEETGLENKHMEDWSSS